MYVASCSRVRQNVEKIMNDSDKIHGLRLSLFTLRLLLLLLLLSIHITCQPMMNDVVSNRFHALTN